MKKSLSIWERSEFEVWYTGVTDNILQFYFIKEKVGNVISVSSITKQTIKKKLYHFGCNNLYSNTIEQFLREKT